MKPLGSRFLWLRGRRPGRAEPRDFGGGRAAAAALPAAPAQARGGRWHAIRRSGRRALLPPPRALPLAPPGFSHLPPESRSQRRPVQWLHFSSAGRAVAADRLQSGGARPGGGGKRGQLEPCAPQPRAVLAPAGRPGSEADAPHSPGWEGSSSFQLAPPAAGSVETPATHLAPRPIPAAAGGGGSPP